MSSSDVIGTQRFLAREWIAVRVVVIGGFLLALAAGLYFGVVYPDFVQPREIRTILHNRVQAILGAEAQICAMGLNTAKNFGIVPQYGQLTTTRLARTDVQGRYVCIAGTSAAKYLLAVDLVCHDLKNPRCISLYNVSQPDGTVLFQRQR